MGFVGGLVGKAIAGFLLGLVKLWGFFRLGKAAAFRQVETETRETQKRMRNVKEPTSDDVTDALDRGDF